MVDFLFKNARWLSAGMLMTFATCLGQTFFISVFADKIMGHYALSDGDWGAIYALGTLISGVLMIFAGGVADRFRARNLAVIFFLGLSLTALLMGLNTHVALLPFLIFLLRFCGQGMLFHVGMIAMSRWFSQNRGKAIAIATLGFSIGEALLPLIFVYLMGWFDWQTLWLFCSAIGLLYIPVMLVLLAKERTPSEIAESEEATPGLLGQHWSRKQVLRIWAFWAVLLLFSNPSIHGTSLFFQQVHIAEIKGWSHAEFVALFPIYTVTAIVAMMLTGPLIDRIGARRMLPFYQLPLVIGLCVLSQVTGIGGAMVALILIAIMHGASSTIGIAMWAELFGTKHLGSIKAIATGAMVFGSAIGPLITGTLIDFGISFPQQMPFYAAMTAVLIVIAEVSLRRFEAKVK